MNIKILLIIAVTAATLFVLVGTFKQAYAYNLLVTVGSHNVGNIIKLSIVDDAATAEDQAKADDVVEEHVTTIEPAAGE